MVLPKGTRVKRAGPPVEQLDVAKLRDIPVEGQQVEFRQFDVVIDKMQNSRIDQIRIFPNVPESLELLPSRAFNRCRLGPVLHPVFKPDTGPGKS